MEFKGFKISTDDSQFIIEVVFPEQLRSVFFTRFYGRGPACDGRSGDPVEIWHGLSYNYNSILLVAPKQVHGTSIIPACKSHALPERKEADGVFISEASDCFGSLRFADCFPLVIAGSEPRPWLLLLHSGFAGTVKNIAAAGVAYVDNLLGFADRGFVWAWIGPGICPECYCRKIEGDELTRRALKSFAAENYTKSGGLCFFDIRRQLRLQLLDIGLDSKSIYYFDCCTRCGGASLYSYRGGDEQDRIFLLAGNATK